MRVLVIGGGVAGLTLAALLRRQGREPEIVDRSPRFSPNGYGLMLFPLGNGVLHGLGLFDAFLARGMLFHTFELNDARGAPVEAYELGPLTERVGPMVSIRRPDLMELLRDAAGPNALRMGTSVTALDASDREVAVTFSDGERAAYDLVVAADGMHSATRRLLFGPDRHTHQTGHAMFVWWAPPDLCEPGRASEWWGPGIVAATYPVPGAVECALVLPDRDESDARAALDGFGGARLDGMRAALEAADEVFPWPLHDVRSPAWTAKGRIALLGDAATGFLPTTGVGASSAMRAAAVLADELSRADGAHVPHALDLYVRRAKPVVERHQRDSRRFGKLMYVDSRMVVQARDAVLRHYSASHFVHQTEASNDAPM
jgi:2-polyprenyl-6-methoxyphenol hydroxylase-like FAD-dependent oxidoreductase